MLTRSFHPEAEQSKLLAYTPMFHARLFEQEEKYRRSHLQSTRPVAKPKADDKNKTEDKDKAEDKDKDKNKEELWLDGNPSMDRPLFVQFCANDPEHLLAAARLAAPYCDAVDLNLGCPQGIARKGHYGSFLQEDQELIYRLINRLHLELPVPVTAKIRVLDTPEATVAYARNVLAAGASILTVHGRRREQKGHLTGLADWAMIRHLRDTLPPETVIFANGNVLQHGDVERCLAATGADAVMSAEGNLSDPTIFAPVPEPGQHPREYWRSEVPAHAHLAGWRVDAVLRRYLDILHRHVDQVDPPQRRPLFLPGDDESWLHPAQDQETPAEDDRPSKRRKTDAPKGKGKGKNAAVDAPSPNLGAVQAHLFHLLRHLVSRHTDVRDMLARECSPRKGLPSYERVLAAVETKVAEGLLEYHRSQGATWDAEVADLLAKEDGPEAESSVAALKRCKRPWWLVQPIIRPMPAEALAKGAIKLSKKDEAAKATEAAEPTATTADGASKVMG